ncbi:MAG: ElyC/SanA/YdcF family protein [Patescibacteria group bacterium]
MKRCIRLGIIAAALLSAVVLFIIGDVQLRYLSKISSLDKAKAEIAMVLGASITSDGKPSDALRDRLLIGAALYKNGAVQKILITGDDGDFKRDEIETMKSFLLDNQIPDQDILVDGQGYRTYESCKRAVYNFKLHDVVIVTQRFHMARALYLCNNLGLKADGVTSDLQTYKRGAFFWIRDLAASLLAWWDIHIWAPRPPA